MPHKKALLCLIVCIVSCSDNLFSQTCVIAKKYKNAIYVGADSRIILSRTDIITKNIDSSLGSMCKIYNVGKFNFAVLGNDIYDEVEIAKKLCSTGENFNQIMLLYGNEFGNKLLNQLEFYRKNAPDTYISIVEKNRPVVSQTFFFGYEADSSFLAVIMFRVTNNFFDPVQIRFDIMHLDLLYGGHIEEIRDTIQKKHTWRRGPKNTIKSLIEIESRANPIDVGGQINMIRVKRKSIKWIPKKNGCS